MKKLIVVSMLAVSCYAQPGESVTAVELWEHWYNQCMQDLDASEQTVEHLREVIGQLVEVAWQSSSNAISDGMATGGCSIQ